MAKTGDTVRFLNSVGGGVITRIEGNMAYVEENGFETPVLLKEVVVVMPAGHVPDGPKGSKKMFDQKAYDAGRKSEPARSAIAETLAAAAAAVPEAAPVAQAPLPPIPETAHGDKLNLVLAFEPADVKRLSATTFNAVLVNDSNYWLTFTLTRRADGERGWTLVWQGEVAPNELIDLATYTHANLSEIERVNFQCVAYKKDKPFELKPPVSLSRRLDLTKFHKLHCFRPGTYFETPVLEIPLVSNDIVSRALEVNVSEIEETITTPRKNDRHEEKNIADKLSKRFNVSSQRKSSTSSNDALNPHKVLPLIEVDLHISELTDTMTGLDNAAMLQIQLDEVRRVMTANRQRIGQKIVFIHGKGEGVLRKAVLALLKKEYPKAEIQDASFQEYGFGATQVTIH